MSTGRITPDNHRLTRPEETLFTHVSHSILRSSGSKFGADALDNVFGKAIVAKPTDNLLRIRLIAA